MQIYAIKDLEAKTMGTPFFQPSQPHAVRAFKTEINRADQTNTIYLYPEEFDLYYLGEFNEETGEITPKIERILNGIQLKAKT